MAWVEDKLRRLMRDPECVRNVTIIAHVDHGKTTLSDSLLQRAGLLSAEKTGTACALDTNEQEQERGITIASTSIALPLDIQADYTRADVEAKHEEAATRPLLLNLIDSPGHSDFNSEVTAALRLTDGAVVVVDASEGVLAQTETVLRQAIQEGVRPCLFVNKVDRLISELKLTPDAAVDTIMRTIESVNSVVATYAPADQAHRFTVSFESGTVGIGSGYYGWGFSMDTLAMLYSKAGTYTAAEVRAMFAHKKSAAKTYKRVRKAIIKLGLKPIYDLMKQVHAAFEEGCDEAALNKVWSKLATLGCPTPKVSASASGVITEKAATKAALRSFCPVATSVLYMVSYYLPSPVEAQAYRAVSLYTGPSDDTAAASIAACSTEGPLVVYVSKMVPVGKKSKGFIACGRVYSGTVRPGDKVLVLPASAVPRASGDGEESKDPAGHGCKAYPAVVQRVVALLGAKHIAVDEVPCGNVVGLMGLDKHLLKCGTITDAPTTWPMKAMRFSVSPVVRVALTAPKQHLNSQLHNAVRAYSKTDPCVQHYVDPETHELVLAGAGELHLDVAVTSIGMLTGFGRPTVSQPVVSYRETVRTEGPVVLAKSANKLNRLFFKASPLAEGLVWRLEAGAVAVDDTAGTARVLAKEFGWDATHAKRIWCWAGGDGGSSCPTNVLVDCTTGAQHLPAIRANVVNAFRQVCDAGGVAGERLRGVRFDLTDAMVHRDPAHRGPSQIVPAACRVFKAAQLSADPCLVQPVFRVTAQVPEQYFGAIQSAMSSRSGLVDDVQAVKGTPLLSIGGTMPVANSFGFAGDVRGLSSGRACAAMQFDSWRAIDGTVWTESVSGKDKRKSKKKSKGATNVKAGRGAGGAGAGGATPATSTTDAKDASAAAAVVAAIRERKGMAPAVPTPDSLCDVL